MEQCFKSETMKPSTDLVHPFLQQLQEVQVEFGLWAAHLWAGPLCMQAGQELL